MAPTPSAKSNQMALTPSSKANQIHSTQAKTPQSKLRLNFNMSKPSPNPNAAARDAAAAPAEHPVEVIGRIRDYPDRKEKPVSALQINPDRQSVRVKTDIGYRDFSLDGVSLAEEEGLDRFYKKFVESRINGVKLGDKCTIMTYGPTGSGKSHTMFGCSKQPGLVYRSLRDILGEGEEEETDGNEQAPGVGTFVQVTILEVYNEEIYDLLSTNNGGGFSFGFSKGCGSKVRLEVMGKKAKNATFISGNEAGKISREIQKVEKRRIVKSTLCNERSSRSHCMIILDVPTVGGRLMLVDMAGSENIEQAGQTGLEAKMQTAKINQGNIALKRVVESIANGDNHVPFRDSKLTMLLQDSFEDDKSKILMVLCASPDPKEMHKTISTLEYGAKAKCIVRGPHTPIKDNKGAEDSSSAVILGSRIAAMDQFIYKLQMENKQREKEKNEAHKELMNKEEEIAELRAKLEKGSGESDIEINLKVDELRNELDKKIHECQKMANEYVEMERRKMEERIFQQQQEVEMLRRRLEEIEFELYSSKGENAESVEIDGSGFASKLMQMYAGEDPGMEKSMDLDKSMDLENNGVQTIFGYNNTHLANSNQEDDNVILTDFVNKAGLSTVFEAEEEEEEEDTEKPIDEEVQKEVIEEKKVTSIRTVDNCSSFASPLGFSVQPHFSNSNSDRFTDQNERQMRIQNIFTLCGNYRELHSRTPNPAKRRIDNFDSPVTPVITIGEDRFVNKIQNYDGIGQDLKENFKPFNESGDDLDVYVKWEASKENPGKLITSLKIGKDSTLADLRKLIEIYLGADNQAFTFLVLGDPSGAPVGREKESTVPTSKLPICNNQLKGHLACLRPAKGTHCAAAKLPFSPLENKLPVTPNAAHQIHQQDDSFSPKTSQHLSSSTPFITVRRH